MDPVCSSSQRGLGGPEGWGRWRAGGGVRFAVPDCRVWKTWDYQTFSLLFAQTRKQTNASKARHTSHDGKPKRPPLPPPLPPPGFHPPLMFGTLIPNTPSPTFWSIGFTRRCVTNLHNLKVLPPLLMLPDESVGSSSPLSSINTNAASPLLPRCGTLGFGAIFLGKTREFCFSRFTSEMESGFWHHSWSHDMTEFSSTSSPSPHITCFQCWCSSNQ